MNPTLVPIILSGGAGTRLWPVSRRAYPKPFMRMADGATLLGKTLARAVAVAPLAPLVTVTGKDYLFVTRDEYTRVDRDAASRMRYLLVLPADHLIRDIAEFSRATQAAAALAQNGRLVTFGVAPTRPETGYGYIEAGAPIGTTGFEVARFVEKPDHATAVGYVSSGRFHWNSGMFCFRADALVAAAEKACPDVLAAARACVAASDASNHVIELDAKTFGAIPEISIDYAVMERAANVALVPARFDWSDIGSWTAMSEQLEPDAAGNRARGDTFLIGARDCYVQASTRTVAALGVSDLTIIETSDAVL